MNSYQVEILTMDFALAYDIDLKANSMDQAEDMAAAWMASNGFPLHRFQYVIEQTGGIWEPFLFP